MGHETTRRCRFTTDRLVVDEWRRLADRCGLDLVDVTRRVLTISTTAGLPPDWRGDFDRARAHAWIEARDAESPTLLVVERQTGDAVGFVIVSEERDGSGGRCVDIRLGYVLAEASWGKGLASELVGGLVEWARSEPAVRSISGGVAADNLASARVLHKHGFSVVGGGSSEQVYRLDIG